MSTPASTAKTWGPFTGRQLTTIIVALIIGAVLLPGAVWAVDTFSNVAIQDPTTGAKTKVDAAGKLHVGDGAGGLTVDGAVTAAPRPPGSPWSHSSDIGSYEYRLIAGPSATFVNVTSVSFGVYWNTTTAELVTLEAFSVPPTATTCTTADRIAVLYRVPWVSSTTGPFHASFPTPLQIRPRSGQKVCLYALAVNQTISFNASGYYGT